MTRQNALLHTASLTFALSLASACSSTAASQPPASAAHEHQPAAAAEPAKAAHLATAVLAGPPGSQVSGRVTFNEGPQGVAVIAQFTGASGNGLHGFHLHEVGDCTPPDFTSAGGHFNPTGAPHGARDAAQHHAGDLGNIRINADGAGRLELTSHSITVAPGPSSVIGRSVILHEKEDDLVTQPTGNAGGRIACGVIKAAG